MKKKRKKTSSQNLLKMPLSYSNPKTPINPTSRKLIKVQPKSSRQSLKRKIAREEKIQRKIEETIKFEKEKKILREKYEEEERNFQVIDLFIDEKNSKIINLSEEIFKKTEELEKSRTKNDLQKNRLQKQTQKLKEQLTERRAKTKEYCNKLARTKNEHKNKLKKLDGELEKQHKFFIEQHQFILKQKQDLEDLEEENKELLETLAEFERRNTTIAAQNEALFHEVKKYETDLDRALEGMGDELEVDDDIDEYIDEENKVRKISNHPCFKNGKEFSGIYKLLVCGICSQGRCSTRAVRILFPLIKKFAIACEKTGHSVSKCLIEPSHSTTSRWNRHITPFLNDLFVGFQLTENDENITAANLHHDASKKNRNDLLSIPLTFKREEEEIYKLEQVSVEKKKKRSAIDRKKGYKQEINFGKREQRVKQDTLILGIERIPDGTSETSKNAIVQRIEKTEKICKKYFDKDIDLKKKINNGFIISDKCPQAEKLSKQLQEELQKGEEKSSLWFCLCHKDHSKNHNV